MKKFRKKIVLGFMAILLCCSTFAFVGCGPEKFDPYITVSGIETEYAVNEALGLSNAVVTYYESEEEADTQKITAEMVAWSGTAAAGNFTMTILYRGESATVDYVVYDVVKMAELVKETTKNQTAIQENHVVDDGVDFTVYMKDIAYSFVQEGTTINQMWDVVEIGGKHSYHYTTTAGNVTDATMYTISSEIGIDDFASCMDSYVSNSNYVKTIIKNSNGTFTLNFTRTTEDLNSSRVYSEAYIVKNGLMQSKNIRETETLNGSTNAYEYTYLYTYENVAEIPQIPQNVNWTISDK